MEKGKTQYEKHEKRSWTTTKQFLSRNTEVGEKKMGEIRAESQGTLFWGEVKSTVKIVIKCLEGCL